MKKVLLAVLSIFVITGCSNLGVVRESNGNKIEVIEDPESFDTISYIDFYDYQALVEKEKQQAKLELRKVNFSKLPKYGYLVVNVTTPTIGSANTKFWTTIVQDNEGNVLLRKKGPNYVANHKTIGGYTSWRNLYIVNLPEIEKPFNVYVVDEVNSQRWGFKVY
ncbi:hypothetical protein [Microbulbifer spongiae]|uniref:Uncharacterized protein n=1 Tax=Microbulbifer spongiae TaxID=2944933 RepID=A0ABY9ED00_9GAMM|nr:hypothetical protein [Microbulbifer sp. MI-G]WKD50517.1 hypothetical protein M8T91_03535 [Microbulbifer sp. MI-G]